MHGDGEGFHLSLDYLPLNGADIVVRKPKVEPAQEPDAAVETDAPDIAPHVMIIGHNPGVQNFAQHMTGRANAGFRQALQRWRNTRKQSHVFWRQRRLALSGMGIENLFDQHPIAIKEDRGPAHRVDPPWP